MQRWLFFALWCDGCTCCFWPSTPTWLDSWATFGCPNRSIRPSGEPVATAVVINLLLLALFGVQHSVMARPAFKRVWTRIVPEPIERSTYVLASNAVTILLMWQWRGIDQVVWNVEQPVVRVRFGVCSRPAGCWCRGRP